MLKNCIMKKTLDNLDWDKAFCNKTCDELISVLNKTIINLMGKFIPNETIV